MYLYFVYSAIVSLGFKMHKKQEKEEAGVTHLVSVTYASWYLAVNPTKNVDAISI